MCAQNEPTALDRHPDIVILTGMAGSGRTQALHTFEDIGYFCIDNLPPRLIEQLAQMIGINAGVGRHLAVTCDLRSQGLFDELDDCLHHLDERELSYQLVFLDARDEVLMRRFDESRRRHPLQKKGEKLEAALVRERRQLALAARRADFRIDTSDLRPRELSRRLRRLFSELSEQQLLDVRVMSFGFKYGMPAAADIMIDVRFLPNPYYDPKMRPLTGQDEVVARYVLDHDVTRIFLTRWQQLLDAVMPGYIAEGKSQLTLAIGCTGGQHRSVAIARVTADYLVQQGYQVSLSHRDIAHALPHAVQQEMRQEISQEAPCESRSESQHGSPNESLHEPHHESPHDPRQDG